jgi:hypothetical protein
MTSTDHLGLAIGLAIGAIAANMFSVALTLIESAKAQEKEEY